MNKKQLTEYYEKETNKASWVAFLSLCSIGAVLGLVITEPADFLRTRYCLFGLFFSALFFASRFHVVKIKKECSQEEE